MGITCYKTNRVRLRQLPTMQCEKGHEGAHRNTKPRPLISLCKAASLWLLAYLLASFEDRHSWWLKWVQPNQAPSGLSPLPSLAGLEGRRWAGLHSHCLLLIAYRCKKASLIITHANMVVVHRDRRDHGIEHTNWLMSRFKSLHFKLEDKHAVKGQRRPSLPHRRWPTAGWLRYYWLQACFLFAASLFLTTHNV